MPREAAVFELDDGVQAAVAVDVLQTGAGEAAPKVLPIGDSGGAGGMMRAPRSERPPGTLRVRLKEATALLKLGLLDGAYYLAGYAVECALKACIAKGTQRGEFPDRRKVESSHSHKLWDLVKVAGLEDAHLEQAGRDPDFRTNWDLVQSWSEQSRYRRHRSESAQALLGAVGDQRHGVISWIKLHW